MQQSRMADLGLQGLGRAESVDEKRGEFTWRALMPQPDERGYSNMPTEGDIPSFYGNGNRE